MSDTGYRVEMRGIVKHFGGVKALSNAQLCLRPGEIHALIGENGAGKSTLIRVLSGVHPCDAGEVKLEGKPVHFKNPAEGIKAGISVIYQEFALVPHLTVMENVLLDDFRSGKMVNWAAMRKKAQDFLKSVGFDNINVDAKVNTLSVAYQQVVEICKALTRNASVLVLDEPTAVMTNKEVKQLFRLLRDLKAKGVSILYVSHRLEEIFEICDMITVMRDGSYVKTVSTSDITQKELASLMVGRDMSNFFPPREHNIGEEVLRAEHIKAGIMVKDISFNVRKGEIVGLSGLVGAGRTESVRAMLGIDPMESGKIIYNGKEIRIKNIKDAFSKGIGLLSEDRKRAGVLLRRPIYQNITISALDKITKMGFVAAPLEKPLVQKYVDGISIKVGSVRDNVNSLSGGNQQKVALAKILATDSKVLILDEPTRGVDVGAKIEIFNIINDLVEQGYAVIMISSEMAEIIGMCDRAFVIYEGENRAELQRDELTEDNIIQYQMGVQ
jgi:ribose transport system ATP-binding protein